MGKNKYILIAAVTAVLVCGCGRKKTPPAERAMLVKDPAKAAKIYDRMLLKNPNDPDALIGRGMLSLDEGRNMAAADYFTTALVYAPQSGKAYNMRATAYLRMKSFTKAMADAERSAKLNADSLELLDELGQALIKAGRPGDAITVYKRAVAVNPEMPDTRVQLADAMAANGDNTGALAAFSEIIKDFPARASRAYLGRCRLKVSMGQARQALDDCAAASDSGAAQALLTSGDIYAALGDNSAAVSSYRQYLKAVPDDAEASVSLADMLFYSGDYSEAADLYFGSVAQSSPTSGAYYRMAISAMHADKCEQTGPVVADILKNFYRDGNSYAVAASYYAYCGKDSARALESLSSAFRLGFNQYDALSPSGEYGYFLKSVAGMPEYAALVDAARKNNPSTGCADCDGLPRKR